MSLSECVRVCAEAGGGGINLPWHISICSLDHQPSLSASAPSCATVWPTGALDGRTLEREAGRKTGRVGELADRSEYGKSISAELIGASFSFPMAFSTEL